MLSYLVEFSLTFLLQTVKDTRLLVSVVLFNEHLVKNTVLSLYYNRDIQLLFNFCGIFSGLVSILFLIISTTSKTPTNIITLLLVILLPLSYRLAQFLDVINANAVLQNTILVSSPHLSSSSSTLNLIDLDRLMRLVFIEKSNLNTLTFQVIKETIWKEG